MLNLEIIIVNFNTEKFLEQCLNSIYANKPAGDFKVWVIDNNSKDRSREMVREKFKQVVLIENDENLGYAGANNIALRLAQGKYILILNPDTVIQPGSLDIMIGFMDKHSEVGVLGPKILNSDGTLQRCCRSFPALGQMFFEDTLLNRIINKNRLVGKYRMSGWDYNDIREVDQPMGSALMLRKKALKQVGLMDERFFMYYEDVDLCYRIKKEGWKIYLNPQAQVIHYGGQSHRWAVNEMFLEQYRSRYKFFKKHYGRLSASLLKFITFIGLLWRIAVILIGPSYLVIHKKQAGYWQKKRLALKKHWLALVNIPKL
jgi:GT2 family glycosyltransferase